MPKPIGFHRLPGMNGVQHSYRNATGPGAAERGTFYATDEKGAGGAPRVEDGRRSVISRRGQEVDMRPYDLSRATEKDLEALREQGEQVVIARLSEDLASLTDAAQKLVYLRRIIGGGSLAEQHFVYMQIDEAIEEFTGGDPFKGLGRTFDSACMNHKDAYCIEMTFGASLSPEERERIADMIYVNARRHQAEYGSFKAALLSVHDVIGRYKLLRADDKVRKAQSFLLQLQEIAKDRIDDMELPSLLKRQFGASATRAEFLLEEWRAWGEELMENVLFVGYERAASVLNAYADEFDKIPGAEKKAAIYRKKADEYRCIGRSLGLIEA